MQEKKDANGRFFSFGNKLRELRKRKGRTQAQMAAIVGCSPTNYWKYEKGIRELPLNFLQKIGQSEGMETVIWLLSDDSNKGQIQATVGSNDTGGLDDLYAHLKTLGETNKALLDKLADLEGRELPTIAVPMDPEFWDALMRLPQEHFDAMKAATLSVVREHGFSEPDESRPVLRVSIPSAKGTLK